MYKRSCLLRVSGMFRAGLFSLVSIFQDVLACFPAGDAPVAMRPPWRCSLIFPSGKNRAVGVQNIPKNYETVRTQSGPEHPADSQ